MNGAGEQDEATRALGRSVSMLTEASQQLDLGNARLAGRLSQLQALVGDDLAWVESALAAGASGGPAPGSEAAGHLVQRGGKRVRPLALLLSAACFGAVPAAARELAVVAELIHSATLLHDDVIDEGDERRGAPTSRRLYGNAVSVLGGDLLLVHALERTQRAAPEHMTSLVGTLRELVEGEIVQLRGRTQLDPSEQTYLTVLRGKTASLFRWATRTGAAVAGAVEGHVSALATFGEQLGMAYQLVDDVLDYTSEDTGKTLHADLCEGKLTLPLVLTLAQDGSLLEPVRRIHAGDLSPLETVRRAVLASGACDETRRRASRATERALAALGQVPAGRARELLHGIALELTGRSS